MISSSIFVYASFLIIYSSWLVFLPCFCKNEPSEGSFYVYNKLHKPSFSSSKLRLSEFCSRMGNPETWDLLLLHILIFRLVEHVEHFSRAVDDTGVVLARKLVA